MGASLAWHSAQPIADNPSKAIDIVIRSASAISVNWVLSLLERQARNWLSADGQAPHPTIRIERRTYAGKRNASSGETGQGPRQISQYSGRRVCARGNKARSRRKARRGVGEAIDCDRSIKGAAGWGQTRASSQRKNLG